MIIFKIAKNELRNLFYSPVAWFLAFVFLMQCAYAYVKPLCGIAIIQDSNLLNSPDFKDWGLSLTNALFFSDDGIITNVSRNLYLFIPLLTMGLLSRDVNTGTIKLLYSSPVKLRQIVLGKYLAVMLYNMVLLGILGFFMVSGAFHIKAIDYGWLLSAMLGFYLLICAYSAIGLFMSSLTTYQIVSAIGTFITLFVLGRIGTLWQKYDFIRDLTWFLSIAGRTDKMLAGLITTKDVLYFLFVIGMFISFTFFKLKGGKESKPLTIKAARYVIVVITCVLLGYITSRPGLVGYWDTTAEKTNTISPKTQKILQKMVKEPLEITLYANLLGDGFGFGLPETRNLYLSTLWDQYQRFKPDIKFKYVYYYDNDGRLDDSVQYKTYPHKTEKQIAGIAASQMELDSSMFMPAAEIRKHIDPYPENLRLFMTAKYKGDTVNLRTYTDGNFWPYQTEVASKLKRLVDGRIPHVYYLTGDLERSIHKTGEREYSAHSIDKSNRNALVNQGFDVDTLSLEEQDIPSNATALVLADPKTQLRPTTLNKLQQYISKGGNLLIVGEPGKQAILNPLLLQIGVQLRTGELVQLDKNETPDKVYPYATDDALKLLNDDGISLRNKHQFKMADTALKGVMFGAAALSYTEKGSFSISPLLRTFKKGGWLKMGRLVIDSIPPVFSPQDGDIQDPPATFSAMGSGNTRAAKGAPSFSISGHATVSFTGQVSSPGAVGFKIRHPTKSVSSLRTENIKASSFVTAVQLTRQINNRQQRIIVLGDADYLSNLRSGAGIFGNSFYSWLDNKDYQVFIPMPVFKDNLLTITGTTAKILRTVYVWVLPGLLLLAGTILLIRRKRK